MSALSSFPRKNFDQVITADKCFQDVDDIGIGAYDTDDMIEKLRALFSCIRESGMKLAIDKCQFRLRKIQFLGKTITSEGLAPISRKVENFAENLRCHKQLNK